MLQFNPVMAAKYQAMTSAADDEAGAAAARARRAKARVACAADSEPPFPRLPVKAARGISDAPVDQGRGTGVHWHLIRAAAARRGSVGSPSSGHSRHLPDRRRYPGSAGGLPPRCDRPSASG
jgi:hypothetical protein